MESQNKFQVSRRTLLKDTAIGAAGVSTMGIADIASAATKQSAKKAHKAPTAQIRNFDMIEAFYANYPKKLAAVRSKLNRPLTLSEKILYTHLYDPEAVSAARLTPNSVRTAPVRTTSAARWRFSSSWSPARRRLPSRPLWSAITS